MKKILLFLSFLLMSIGMWGAETLYKETIFNSTNNSASIGDYTSTWYNTTNGFRIDISNGNNNQNGWNYIKFGRKNNASTGTIITNVSIDKKVTKIGITIDAITASKITNITLYKSTNKSFWTSLGTFSKSTGTQYYAISTANQSTSLYYKLEFVCQSGSSNGLIQISHIYFYTEDSSPSTYSVTYNANDGTGTMSDSNSPYNSGSTVTVLENLFTREGYTFTNWNTKADGSGTSYNKDDTFTINSDITLYAQWKENVVPSIPVDCDGNYYDFSFTEIGSVGWISDYKEHIIVYTNDSIIFTSADKQSGTITDIPVTKGSDIIIKARNNGKISSINLICRQWTDKTQTITLHYSIDGGSTFTSTGISSTNFKLSYNGFNSNTNAIKFTFSSQNQIGIESVCINHNECENTITINKFPTETGSFDLSTNTVCGDGDGGEVEIINIVPDDGYILDTIFAVDTVNMSIVGTTNMAEHKITGIKTNCVVVAVFTQLPPKPEIDIVEWNPDYIKVDINNFDAVTAVIENKNTQEIHTDNVATKLFFSKYFEAAGNIKLWAVYNGTKEKISLTNINVQVSSNGGIWTQKLNLSNYGHTEIGWIYPNEEIIVYNHGNLTGTNAIKDTTIMNCVKKDYDIDEWYYHDGSTSFSGDDGLLLLNDKDTLDVIGGINTSTAYANTQVPSFGDSKGWCCENGKTINGDSTALSTNRCLLIRKNTVHSGDSAVKYNRNNFTTLCSEWVGAIVPSGNDTEDILNTCRDFAYVGDYDYGNYYAQYTQVGDEILLGHTEPDGSYQIPILKLDTLSCTYLKVIVNDNSDKTEEREYKIPIFVTENTESNSTLFSQEGADCPECDVVIIKGGKLTVNSELTNRDVTVYPGGVLVIPSNQTYNINSLTLRRDNDSVPYFSYKGTLNTNKFNIDLRTDAEDWRWMTLPFTIHTDSIKLSNGKPINLNNNVWISYYDGKHRSIYQRNAWKDIYKDTVFNAGEGFLFGVDLPGRSKKIYRFSFNKDSVEHEKSDKIIKNLYAWGGNNENLAPNHKGWNLIGNPFMDSDTTDIIDPIRIGRLKKDSVNGRWTGGWVVDSITTKLRYAVIPNKDEEFADAGYYESVVLDDYVLQPLTSFFVQIGGNENDMQTLTFKPEKRTNRIVARKTPINERDEELFLRIKIGNKKTGCFISNHFNENYEPGDDLESRYAYYQLINGYKLLYSAINDSIIENGIQIHSVGGKVTLDSKVETEKFEQIYILYNNEWYDLLHGDEPEVSSDFVLYGKRKISEDIPTDIENIKPGQGTYKFLYENNIFINNKGKIYNVLGNKIH